MAVIRQSCRRFKPSLGLVVGFLAVFASSAYGSAIDISLESSSATLVVAAADATSAKSIDMGVVWQDNSVAISYRFDGDSLGNEPNIEDDAASTCSLEEGQTFVCNTGSLKRLKINFGDGDDSLSTLYGDVDSSDVLDYRVNGNGGADVIVTGTNDDVVSGGSGRDEISTGEGEDVVGVYEGSLSIPEGGVTLPGSGGGAGGTRIGSETKFPDTFNCGDDYDTVYYDSEDEEGLSDSDCETEKKTAMPPNGGLIDLGFDEPEKTATTTTTPTTTTTATDATTEDTSDDSYDFDSSGYSYDFSGWDYGYPAYTYASGSIKLSLKGSTSTQKLSKGIKVKATCDVADCSAQLAANVKVTLGSKTLLSLTSDDKTLSWSKAGSKTTTIKFTKAQRSKVKRMLKKKRKAKLSGTVKGLAVATTAGTEGSASLKIKKLKSS